MGVLELWRQGTHEKRMPKTQSNTKFQSTFGKREQGILQGPARCLIHEGPQLSDRVANNFKKSETVTAMRNLKFRPCGRYVIGFLDTINLSGLWTLEPCETYPTNVTTDCLKIYSFHCMKMVHKCWLQMVAEPIRMAQGTKL